MDLATILTRCGMGSKDPERVSVYEHRLTTPPCWNDDMPVFSRPKTPLGVCGFERHGRGKRCRPIHFDDIDDHPMGGQCAICQEPIKCHRTLFETECGHCFHHA